MCSDDVFILHATCPSCYKEFQLITENGKIPEYLNKREKLMREVIIMFLKKGLNKTEGYSPREQELDADIDALIEQINLFSMPDKFLKRE